ncbi:aminopeptidase A [Sphaerotilus mobilis]|uniref:Probable cytosol aminopeptidase n=2 Tax=Sphaerotilus mobilis TaxID=47994 RepID=A0A4Q7LUF4_9BURK|nr:leucyl aminopeptidase [Sphaerotilus mobilis]RZS57993.1 aminopeptidase A [Sphaerotilus mobilis]
MPEDWSGHATPAWLIVLPSDPKTWRPMGAIADLAHDAVRHGDLELKNGKQLYLHRPAGLKAQRLVFVVASDLGAKAWRGAVAAGVATLKNSGASAVVIGWAGPEPLGDLHGELATTAFADALYTYRHTKPSAPAAAALGKLAIAVDKTDKAQLAAVRAGLARGTAIGAGVTLARECANRPGNHCTPTQLAAQARALAEEQGLAIEVLDRKAMAKLGMGALLAVAQGSDEPPQFIVLRYEGATRKSAPIVLVGKGITFDTGGISIKPAAEMDEMKFDMGGAASVLGTMRAVAELKPKVNLIGVIPTCENMPDGRAVKPGDVVTSLSGQTIEILNTDAEGRLILCDALTYVERFKPTAVVDIATLTGACVIALGHQHSGLFSADDALADSLLGAGRRSLDSAWRMPLDDEYADGLKSNFADVGNVGGRAGGAITAALFLKRFTSAYRWAHLDIAGTAWKSGAAKGATGRPVPLLTHFVLDQAEGKAG